MESEVVAKKSEEVRKILESIQNVDVEFRSSHGKPTGIYIGRRPILEVLG